MTENEGREVHKLDHPYQITLYVDKDQYKKLRAILVLDNRSVSQWVRGKIALELSNAPWKAASRSTKPDKKEGNDEQPSN